MKITENRPAHKYDYENSGRHATPLGTKPTTWQHDCLNQTNPGASHAKLHNAFPERNMEIQPKPLTGHIVRIIDPILTVIPPVVL